ncbi:hypothetical protein E1B28_009297 [Marasmius oreades]|uniref:Uncharacterized protein n=1 Tax=Marasmius oreades TaxID=181124 RepID=A0A9P7S1T0_9AGAR|nr:uncharacterized protein E1B28_009297 [Marasmius oreades]KAG7092998.1 hypothetical protein E1B28_009297 [Marasmius oreades]
MGGPGHRFLGTTVICELKVIRDTYQRVSRIYAHCSRPRQPGPSSAILQPSDVGESPKNFAIALTLSLNHALNNSLQVFTAVLPSAALPDALCGLSQPPVRVVPVPSSKWYLQISKRRCYLQR